MLLTFDFKTVEEAQDHLAWLLKKPGPNLTATEVVDRTKEKLQDAPRPPVPVKDIEATIEILEKKKRGPKPKAGRNFSDVQILAAKQAAEKAVAKEYGIEDCRTALSGLFDVKGRDAAKAALAEFKVARIGELKADQYRGFIVLCETLSQPE